VSGARTRRQLPPRALAGLVLGGVPLNVFDAPTKLSVTDLRMLYEEHIDRYVVASPHSPQVELDLLRQALGINDKKLEAWWLPANLLEWEGGALAILTTILSNKLDIRMQGAVLDAGNFKIGVDVDGTVYSRFHKDLRITPHDCTRLLHQTSFGSGKTTPVYASLYRELVAVKSPSAAQAMMLLQLHLNEAEFCCLYSQRKIGTDKERFRHCPRELPLKHLRKVESMVRITHKIRNPVPKLWRSLVQSGVIPPREFVRLFDHDTVYAFRTQQTPIPESRREVWLSTITTIIKRKQRGESPTHN